MKKRVLICVNVIVFLLLIVVSNGNKAVKLKEDEYAQVFAKEISGRLTNQNNFMEDIVLNESNKETIGWGVMRNKEHKTPCLENVELLKKYNSYCVGDTSKKKIYLTFDEGYENGYTGKILDTLKMENIKAVFFITGPYLKDHPELVERMIKEGHEVGNHTVNHPSLPSIDDKRIRSELKELDSKFYEKFNTHMTFFRAPKGEYSERTLKITNDMGYINLFWSFAYDDWYRDKVRGKDYAHKIVTENLHNGAILLLHAVSKDNADALPYIIKTAKDCGYEFGDCKMDFGRDKK